MKVVHFDSTAAFRAWLQQHHDTAAELWVGFYRKDSGRSGLTYAEADEPGVGDVGYAIEIEVGDAQEERSGNREEEEHADERERRRKEEPCSSIRFGGDAHPAHRSLDA